MQYLLLIYTNEKEYAAFPRAQAEALSAEYTTLTKAMVEAGHLRGGERLHPTSAATTVRVREGKTLTTHGPFAETREQLGGFYLVEAKDLDEASALAARIPGARHGSIEVRPIYPMQRT